MDRTRFEALLPEQLIASARILLVGCGGIGSPTALCLARMGAKNFTLVDPDTVEETNVATQAFEARQIGNSKVSALSELLGYVSDNVVLTTAFRRFDYNDVTEKDIIIMAVDNMETRREVWAACMDHAEPATLIIDPRTGAETLDLYVLRVGGPWEEWYTSVVNEPNNYADDPCGARAIAYGGIFAAAAICSAIRQALLNPIYHVWAAGDLSVHGLKVFRSIDIAA